MKHHFKEKILRPLFVALIIPRPSKDNKFSYGALVKNTVNTLYEELKMKKPLLYSLRDRRPKKFISMFLATYAIFCLLCNTLAINGAAVGFSIPLPDNWKMCDKEFLVTPAESSVDPDFIIQNKQSPDEMVIVPDAPSDNPSSDSAGDACIVPFIQQSDGDID